MDNLFSIVKFILLDNYFFILIPPLMRIKKLTHNKVTRSFFIIVFLLKT